DQRRQGGREEDRPDHATAVVVGVVVCAGGGAPRPVPISDRHVAIAFLNAFRAELPPNGPPKRLREMFAVAAWTHSAKARCVSWSAPEGGSNDGTAIPCGRCPRQAWASSCRKRLFERSVGELAPSSFMQLSNAATDRPSAADACLCWPAIAITMMTIA